MYQPNKSGKKQNPILAFFRTSLIFSAIDGFTAYIYKLLRNGLFGYIFSGYKVECESKLFFGTSDGKFSSHFNEFRFGMCRRIESSTVIKAIRNTMKYFLGLRLKVYGVFLASFGIYTAITSVIEQFYSGETLVLSDNNIILSCVIVFSSLPLILSKSILADALENSTVGRATVSYLGYSLDKLKDYCGDGGHTNIAFILGISAGVLTYIISPVYILVSIFAVFWAYLVMVRPEIGVLSLFFFMPFLPTMILAGIVIYTSVSFLIKLFRSKRILKITPIDIAVAAFTIMLFFGGFISLSPTSIKPALLMVCLICGYFLTTQLISSRKWIVRCASTAVVSATIVSLYGIYLYFTGGGYSSAAWVDKDMFGTIAQRAVSTLENPNMLGEYLVLILPIAVSMLLARGEGVGRLQAFFSIAFMGVCLIITWSRGAWIAFLASMILFVFIWHRRSVWLVLLGIASIPVLPSVLPASIVSRIMSIGNMADTSTSYRMYIWRASVQMIEDNFISGIGIGQGAWSRMYPLYSYMGIEAAPHSHNLYFQIWLELGIFGFVAFLVILFLLFQSVFTLCYKLSDKNISLKLEISDESSKHKFTSEEKKLSLRLSAAGPLCGLFAVLVQGFTDYSWYNYRLYLMFWLVVGLTVAYAKNGIQTFDASRALSSMEHDLRDNTRGEVYLDICSDKKSPNKKETEKRREKDD